jgi:DNA polymerase-1
MTDEVNLEQLPQRNVLLIDAFNIFIRSYCAYPSMNSNGEQVGGVVGFLKTIMGLVKTFSPETVYVAWESGGSLRRRHLYSQYKRGNRPMQLNRYYEDDLPDTDSNKLHQMATLARLLECLPLCQIHVPDCEGDDVIAHLVNRLDGMKIIVSTDRDYYQLLDDSHIRIYDPTRKQVVTEKDVLKEFSVSARNFALAKCICGDASDNVPGIRGFGYKTVAKKFPLLMSRDVVLLEDLISYAAAKREESSHFMKLFEAADDMRRNWKLVHLDTSSIAPAQIRKIDYSVDTFAPSLDKMKFMRLLNEEGIQNLDVGDVCYTFTKLNKIT